MQREVMINGRFLTGALTGVQRVAFELLNALDQAISTNKIAIGEFHFTLIYSGELRHKVEFTNIKLVKKGRLKGNAWEQLELPLLAHNKLLINLCSIAPLFKRRQIVFIHDASFLVNKQYFSRAFRLWYSYAIPLIGKISRQIVTVSEFSKHELITHAHIPGKKIAVIYNSGEHILRFGDPSPVFKKQVDNYKPYCLAVSSLGANKNFKGLCEALKNADLKNHQLLIAGGKMGVLKSGNTPVNATFLGYVTDAELCYLYRNASLFLFPSFYEGFGIPPLEAMSVGCPVISSNTSAMPEVLADAVAYFDPYDLKDMRDKTVGLLYNPAYRASLSKRGSEQASRYRWHDSVKQLFALILQYYA